MANESGVAVHSRATLSPGRYGSPHVSGDFWLDKRPDGRSPLWAVAWYDPRSRTTRYRSTRTADLERAKDFMARFTIANDALPVGRPVEKRPSDLVYFIGGDVGAIKIGLAGNAKRRLATIQAHSPIPVRLLAVIAGGREVEMSYHRRFAAHRLHGEWFEPHPDILAEIDRLQLLYYREN